MTDDDRRRLLDAAAFLILGGVVLAFAVMRAQAYPLIVFAWFPIRWGVARIVAAARPPAPAPRPLPRKPFGYEPPAGPYKPGGPV
jgi:hypothetical protein